VQFILLLKYGVIISFLIAVVSLTILVLKTFSFGKRELYAAPRGNVGKGIAYAFGKGMMPREKESARNHLPSYIGGILYHIGVFAAFFYLFVTVASIDLPNLIILFLRSLFQVGFICGAALLLKRIFSPAMRTLSCPDDFAANIIVDIVLISAILHTFIQEITPFFFLAAIIMFLYMPLGKIRHCFFFFYTRILFGIFYGRRGVFPPKPKTP
jgi:hypothetical protein